MLAFMDRTPDELPPTARMALTVMRIWMKERIAGRCPVWPLRIVLTRCGTIGALWPLHNFMSWTAAHARRPFLGPCQCGRVSDDEALLLSAMFAESDAQAHAALSSMIGEGAVVRAVRGARSFGAELIASHDRAAL